MLTYRTGAAGAPHAAQVMAEYLQKESHVAGLSETLAKYYGYGLMSDEGYTTAGIPMPNMDPAIADLLKIDPTKPLSTMEMANLLSGQRTDGQDIPGKQQQTRNKVRIAYVDFTLSAPKSLSVAISLATAEGLHAEAALLDKCHTDAVDKTLALISETVGTVSKGDTSKNFQRDPGHVAIIKFEHNTARPVEKIADTENGVPITLFKDIGHGDPNRHTHAIMIASAITDDGRVGSIHQQAIKGRIHEFGSLYQAFLATELRKIGVEAILDRRKEVDFNGRMATLPAIPEHVNRLFSKRSVNGREFARQHAAKAGLDYDAMSPAEKSAYIDISMNATKGTKDAVATAKAWQEQARAAGYRYRSVIRPWRKKELARPDLRYRLAYETALPMLEEQFAKRAVIEGSVARVAAAKAFIEHGIESASDINLVTAAMRSEGVRQNGELTKIHWAYDPTEHYARITTQLSVDQEKETIGILSHAAADKSAALSPDAIQRAVDKVAGEGFDFSTGHGLRQREVIDKLAVSGRAAVVVGIAGSGKSTLLRPLIEAWHEDQRDVWGVTLGWRQTASLKDAGIGQQRKKSSVAPKTETLIDAGVSEDRTFALAGFLARLQTGTVTLTPKSVVVIDEVALVGTAQMLTLARHQRQQGFQLVGIGDDMQNQPIEAGATIDLCRRAFGKENVPELISTVRQLKERERETSLMFREGNALKAIKRKDEDGTLHIAAGGYEDAVKATVDLWYARQQANAGRKGYALGISVPTNADGLAIGEEIHRRRIAAGEIQPPICSVDATDQNGVQFTIDLSIGDRVRLFNRVFGKSSDGRNSFVGNNGTVVEVAGASSSHLMVCKADGRIATVEWDDLKEDARERRERQKKGLPPPEHDARIRLTRGDAITIDARQSETLTEHITSMPSGSSAVNGFKAYVANSRHREASYIVASQGEEMQEVQQRRAIGDPRNAGTDPAEIKADILANMGRNLSRQPVKTLATDFMERAVHLHSGTTGAKRAAWHRQESRQAEGKPPLATAARRVVKVEAAGIAPQAAPAGQGAIAPAEAAPQPARKAPRRPPRDQEKPRRPQLSPAEIQAEFARALDSIGLKLNGPPIMDGQKHTVQVDGAKGHKKSGFYRGFADGRRLSVGHNSKSGETVKWKLDEQVSGSRLTPTEREAQKLADREARLREQTERKAKEDAAATVAQTIWDAGKRAHPEHPYLAAKQIERSDLRQAPAGTIMPLAEGKQIKIGGRLIVPLRDEDGKIRNIQVISHDGSKLFLSGRKKGLSVTLGELDPTKPVVIAEGYATAATLRAATSLTTVAAIDSGNLHAVASSLRAKYPEMPLIFAADNDHHLPRRTPPLPNVGVEKAKEAANEFGGVVISPKFAPDDKSTDWNDLRVKQGEEAARKAVEEAFAAVGISELLPPPMSAKESRTTPLTHEEREAAWATAAPIRRSKMPQHDPAADRLNKRPPTQGI